MDDYKENIREKKANSGLIATMLIIVAVVAVVAIIGFVFMNRPDSYVEGQVEGTTVRVSGKLAGRVVELYRHAGDTVRQGDTLAHIHSAVVEAQLVQAQALREAAAAQNRIVDAGARMQTIQTAADLVAQAEAAVTISERTYQRMERLYNEGVVSEQKRDEARAAYDAAVAGRNAAQSQLSLAQAGARADERQASAALVDAAGGTVEQVEALLADSFLTAPCDGTIDEVYPEPGELVALGAPIMSVLRDNDRNVIFNVREELLEKLPMGQKINVMIPALGGRDIEVEVYYIRDMGSYATWRSTKATGSYDSRTFQIKARPTEDVEGLRPGMSAIYRQ